MGEGHEGTNGALAVDNHSVVNNGGSLLEVLLDLGGDLLLYCIDESGLILLVLLFLLAGLVNTVLLGALLLLLSALLLLLDLVLAHYVGFVRGGNVGGMFKKLCREETIIDFQ